jgi:hypothetical protein
VGVGSTNQILSAPLNLGKNRCPDFHTLDGQDSGILVRSAGTRNLQQAATDRAPEAELKLPSTSLKACVQAGPQEDVPRSFFISDLFASEVGEGARLLQIHAQVRRKRPILFGKSRETCFGTIRVAKRKFGVLGVNRAKSTLDEQIGS